MTALRSHRLLLANATLLAAAAGLAQTGLVEGVVEVERGRAAGAVVFLEPTPPMAYAPPAEPAVIDQVELRFVPRVLPVLPGTVVAFPNSDPILHNVFSPRGPGNGFNLGTYPPGESRSWRFTEPGVHVILCHVHPEMAAYVVVVPTPHHGVVDADGMFRIVDVPPGRYVLRVWHGRRAATERTLDVPHGGRVRITLRVEG